MKEKKSINFLKFFFILIKIKQIILECPYEQPYLKDNTCLSSCSYYQINTAKSCVLDNSIIIKQNLDSLIPATDKGYVYLNIHSMQNGDLLIDTSSYPISKERQFFGLKKNGRPYFKNKTTLEETPYYSLTASSGRYESFSFSIKLNEVDDENEYLISVSKDSSFYVELFDFENDEVFAVVVNSFFHKLYALCIKCNAIKISTTNNYYILGIVGIIYTSPKGPHFMLTKLSFNSKDIINNDPFQNSTKTSSSYTRVSSCFESNKKYIICFFQNTTYKYVIGIYDHDLNEKLFHNLVDGATLDNVTFFKTIHFIDEVGAFGYYKYNANESNFYIQFKNYDNSSNTISDYFSSKSIIKIDKVGDLANSTLFNEMIKLSDCKFCFVCYNANKTNIYIIIINNYDGEKIKIRYFYAVLYKIYFYRFPNKLQIDLYNNLISMAISFKNDYASEVKTFLIIFSYPNSTDFDVNITENLKNFTNININPKEKCIINNNLFGYIYSGIKILNFTDGYEIVNNGQEINKADILEEGNFELVLSKKINMPIKGIIEYAMVVTEPNYDVYKEYNAIIDSSYCDGDGEDEAEIFNNNKNQYIGKTSYINIIIDSEAITDNCNNIYCEFCLNDNEKICIRCKYTYKIVNEEKICLTENGEEGNSITTYPLTTEPLTTEPLNLQSLTTQPLTTEPLNLQSLTTQPLTTEPLNLQSLTTQPITTEPDILPTTTNPFTAQALTSGPSTTQPITTDPVITQPIKKDFITTEILTIEPITTEILTTEPITTEILTTIPIIKETTIFQSTVPITQEISKEKETTIPIINEETDEITYKNENKSCSDEDVISNKCNNGTISLNQINEIKKNILNKNYTSNKTNTIIKTQNAIIQLSTVEDQKNSTDPELSNIDLGDCEQILKEANSIPYTESLIIYKTDIKTQDLSATYVIYEVYNPLTLVKLELSVCNDVEININVPVSMSNNMEELYSSLTDSGYNIFNGNDSFYQDICATYTTLNGTDILLSDRKKDIYTKTQNLSMCQTGCQLESYNSETKKAKCSCSLEQESSSELTELNVDNLFTREVIEEKFYNTLANSNFQVLKCYELLFSSKIIKNIGEILMSIVLGIFFILIVTFCFTGAKRINYYISIIVKNKFNQIKTNEIKPTKKKKMSTIFKKNQKGKVIFNKKKRKYFNILSKKKIDFPPKKKSKNNSLKIKDETKLNLKEAKNNSDPNKFNNFYQSNIYLNVNVMKSKKKKKTSKFQKGKKYFEKSKQKRNINIYKLKPTNANSNNIKKFHKMNNKNGGDTEIIINKNDIRFKSLNDYELNSLEYNFAIELDKRTYFQYYWSLLKKKQLLLFAFLTNNDYNLTTIKISLFLISFSLYFTVNGFFFSDTTMHKYYEENGEYDILYQIPKLIYSTLISTVINMILKALSLSEKPIVELKEITDMKRALDKSKNIQFCLRIKFISFFLLSFVIMIFFWYFISCFCAVYVNTQVILIKDTLISFFLSMVYPFGINLIPGIFRIPPLREQKKDKECIYKASKIIALI